MAGHSNTIVTQAAEQPREIGQEIESLDIDALDRKERMEQAVRTVSIHSYDEIAFDALRN